MMRLSLLTLMLVIANSAIGQSLGFTLGDVSKSELEQVIYEKDSTASVVVLNEFGSAAFEEEHLHIDFEYHAKIKVLTKDGLSVADFEIPISKGDKAEEKLTALRASSFNLENGKVVESPLAQNSVFVEDFRYTKLIKFAVPNVRVGSVIDIYYKISSPFVRTFRTWLFQGDYPKISSEFWATIPWFYNYHITLRGYLPLVKQDSKTIRNCINFAGGMAECTRLEFLMKDIPAFKKEKHMTAASNFMAGVYFELSEIKEFVAAEGKKYAMSWEDLEKELRKRNDFGTQLKRGSDVVDEVTEALVKAEGDELKKATMIYNHIRGAIQWNEYTGILSDLGIRKAVERKSGNVADINLALVAAMRHFGLAADPVLLSTRNNGVVPEDYPVITDFNYVIAKVDIAGKTFLVDAAAGGYPFGLIPEKCLNGKGRVIAETPSYWIDLKAPQRARRASIVKLRMDDTGKIAGNMQVTYSGYQGVWERAEVLQATDQKQYIQKMSQKMNGFEVKKYDFANLEDITAPLTFSCDLELETDLSDGELINPFLVDRWDENPFKSRERFYPVDFAVPFEEITIFSLEIPAGFEVVNIAQKIGMALPNSGGRLLLETKVENNTLSLTHSIQINRASFTPDEYHYLKELFNRLIQIQSTDLYVKAK